MYNRKKARAKLLDFSQGDKKYDSMKVNVEDIKNERKLLRRFLRSLNIFNVFLSTEEDKKLIWFRRTDKNE